MKRRLLRGILLCEDLEHERFFRRLLSRKWFGRGKLKVERIPNNRGAGDSWVLNRYSKEVRIARSKRHENYALVVVIDGDQWKPEKRLRQLDSRLKAEGIPLRGATENIAIFVPTRSIESWELWLCGNRKIDEKSDCKLLFQQARGSGSASAKIAVEAWYQELSPEQTLLEERILPSLAAGRAEEERFQ